MREKHRVFDKAEVTKTIAIYHRFCPVCKEPFGAGRGIATFHHSLHDTVGNRRKLPYFIDSHVNGKPVHWSCIGQDNRIVTSDLTAARYERFYSAFAEHIRANDVIITELYDYLILVWKIVADHGVVTSKVDDALADITEAFVQLVINESVDPHLLFLDLKGIWHYLAKYPTK